MASAMIGLNTWYILVLDSCAITAQYALPNVSLDSVRRVLLTLEAPADIRNGEPLDKYGQVLPYVVIPKDLILDLPALTGQRIIQTAAGTTVRLSNLPPGLYCLLQSRTPVASFVTTGSLSFTPQRAGIFTLVSAEYPSVGLALEVTENVSQPIAL